ncbi:MAG: nucleotidyltransferase domain-containing protein [Acidilobaceae archaeon]
MPSGGSSYVKHRIEYLREWRRYARIVAEAARSLLESEVYVVGGAAEGRLTVLSDIDIVIVVGWSLTDSERRRIKADILWAAVERGLPLDYPVEIHIASHEELKEYLKRGKAVKIG